MSSSNLVRWSGLAAILGGVLLAILSILESVLFGSQPSSVAVASSAWIIVEVTWIVAEMLIILGLVGLYAHQAGQVGSLGLVAFVLALTGTVMVSGIDWSAAFLSPWLVETAPEILDVEPAGIFLAGLLLTFVLMALGWLLFGFASLQASVLPRGAAWLLMAGAVLILVLGFLEIGFDTVVFGVAITWMGYALWSASSEPALTAQTAN